MEVATSFVRAYFPCELKPDAPSVFQTFYGHESKLTVGDGQPVSGTAAITDMHTSRLSALGDFKIDLKYVDAVAANRSIVVSVVGSYITREAEHHFVRGFVLQPTPHRDNTYFVLSEWIRETNVVPDRGGRREPASAAVATAQPAVPTPAPVPVAPAATEVEKPKKVRRPALVCISDVPKRCTLGDIRLTAEQFGKVIDVKRSGRDMAVVEYTTLRMAESACKAPEFKINGALTGGVKMITAEELATN
uniref:NTF2 domain-containing protein n=1 Tax=Neobodo designis TaxID=312471 RepID=A0A7S1MQP3_NEODS